MVRSNLILSQTVVFVQIRLIFPMVIWGQLRMVDELQIRHLEVMETTTSTARSGDEKNHVAFLAGAALLGASVVAVAVGAAVGFGYLATAVDDGDTWIELGALIFGFLAGVLALWLTYVISATLLIRSAFTNISPWVYVAIVLGPPLGFFVPLLIPGGLLFGQLAGIAVCSIGSVELAGRNVQPKGAQ